MEFKKHFIPTHIYLCIDRTKTVRMFHTHNEKIVNSFAFESLHFITIVHRLDFGFGSR